MITEQQHQQLATDFRKLSYNKLCAYCGGEFKYFDIPVCKYCWKSKLTDEDRKILLIREVNK